jgi:glycyl-tRNA synthetase beta chain
VTLPFLLEIGTEEIPDWMIDSALDDLVEQFGNVFQNNRLALPKFERHATPRRLVLRSPDFPPGRPEIFTPEDGPLVAVGERAAQGFAKKYGVSVADLKIYESPTGPKYRVEKRVPGEAMVEILRRSLEVVILGVHWPKSMYWGRLGGPKFIRPIRWIVALLGNEVIDFKIAGVKSGNVTSGHRILGDPQIPVTIDSYEQKLRENFVILSAKERESRIREAVGEVRDEELLHTLVYLTEFPTVISGGFDHEYLKLPAEVLITVMKHHQRYFAVHENGKLANRFFAVTNTDGDPEGLIRRGNERVLRARFNDAKFFWETDQKKKLADRIEDLAKVTFHAKLGSYKDKTDLIVATVKRLGGDKSAIRAAQLCKCDLTTELVKEFTELQGVIGGLYARVQGEPDEVWRAIYDHYKPTSMEDQVPSTWGGQLISLADKLDTLSRCFGIGLVPTGSKDPYGLRRAAQGIVKILVEGKLKQSLKPLLRSDYADFVLDRVRYYFRDFRGFRYDEVNAVLASGWDDLTDVEERLLAIQAVRPTEDFEPLAASFKRIRNILRQAHFPDVVWGPNDHPANGAELDLYEGIRVVSEHFEQFRAKKNYRGALETIAKLRPTVDKFFDEVLVNDPDPEKRRIRLTLLSDALRRFSTIADFSEIVTNT